MRFLVTGGRGFIGVKLVTALLREGHTVRVLDNASAENAEGFFHLVTHEGNTHRLEHYRGDITSFPDCINACKNVDVLYQLAALKSVPESVTHPITYNHVNIDGTVKVLEAAKNTKISKVIFASSAAIYGSYDSTVPILETVKAQPISPYGVTKMAGEQYCRTYSYQYGLRTVALRFFNVYGPGQDANDGYAGVISNFINAMVKGQRPKVFGDGKQVRDFVYVDDVVNALVVAKEPRNMRDFEEFNIGSGRGRSLLEIIDITNKELMTHIEPEFFPAQVGDIRTSVAEINKAEMYLGWKPKVSFPKGLLETIKYFQEKVNVVR